jgi:hypothetical protein
MITAVINATARTTADARRLVCRPGLWLTQQVCDAVFRRPKSEYSPVPTPASEPTRPPSEPAQPEVSGADVEPARPAEPHHMLSPLNAAVWTIRPDGSGLQQLTFPGASHDLVPSYSPRGDRIAFERDAADFSTRTVMTALATGGSPTMIQSDAGDPVWGPAGA